MPALTVAQVIALAEKQADLLTTVATGGPRIETVNRQYVADAKALRENLRRLGVDDPFPWNTLWDWHGRWSRDMGTYAERRAFIGNALRPALDALEAIESASAVVDVGTTGSLTWGAVDARLAELVAELGQSSSLDGWQDVARRSREVLIDIAKLIGDPGLVPQGQSQPKAADGKAWLGLFFDKHLPTNSVSVELRNVVNAAWDLAQRGTHGSAAEVHAYAVTQAVVLIARVVQKLQDPDDSPPSGDALDTPDPWEF